MGRTDHTAERLSRYRFFRVSWCGGLSPGKTSRYIEAKVLPHSLRVSCVVEVLLQLKVEIKELYN